MIYFLLWIVFSILVGMFARIRRNRSAVGWAVFSLVLSPLIGIIAVAILKEIPSEASEDGPQEIQHKSLKSYSGGLEGALAQLKDLFKR